MTIQVLNKNFIIKYISIPAFLLVFCFSSLLNAEADTGERKSDKIFLWEVRSNTATVYLLGSLHVFKKTMYPLDHAINEAYEKSDMLVVEVDTSNMNAEETNKIMLREGMYAGDETLEKNLSQETLKMVNKYLDLRRMKLEQVNRMKPWFLNLSIGMQGIQRYGYDQMHGIDRHFLDRAKDSKTILELETLDEQLEMLSGGTKGEQDYALRLTLDSPPEMRNDFYKMINAWTVGDADRLLRIELDRTDKYPELNSYIDRTLFDRNLKMAEKIKGYLKTDKIYFVVAGAMHMGDEKGIVELLQEDEYVIKQFIKTPKKSLLKASTRSIPAYLQSLEYGSFFPDSYKDWMLYENRSEDGPDILKWINNEGHEIELKYTKASRKTIQNVYAAFGKEINEELIERGGNLIKSEEYYALAIINEYNDMNSANLLYGTVNGVYLWKYKASGVLKTEIDKFVKKLSFAARKDQYDAAHASGNIMMGSWGKQIREYARLLAKEESADAEAVYMNLLRTSPDMYDAHIEFTSITQNKKRKHESAKIVMKNAEDEEMLEKAAAILGEKIPDINSYPLLTNEDTGIRVVLVPLPPVNPWILKDVAETYESITTIPVSIRRLPVEWSLPEPSMSVYRPQIERVAASIWPDISDFREWSMDKLREEIIAAAHREGPASVFMVTELFKKVESGEGQWLDDPLVLRFYESLLPYVEDNKKTMYVGITDASIYSDNSNFVYSAFGGSDAPVSILSCMQMTAHMTGETESRRRLIERCAKELVPASLKRLGIPRSIDPSCPYSYADGVQRVDEKSLKLSTSVMEQILYEKGFYFHKNGDLDRALSEYNKTIDLSPEFLDAYINRGKIFRTKGEFKKAISDYSRAIELSPEIDKIYLFRGLAYSAMQKTDHAIEDYSRAIGRNSKYTLAYINRGISFKEKGEHDRALSDYKRALETDPMSALAYNKRGVLYFDTGDLQHAFSDLNKALEINPEYAEAYMHRGMSYGRKEQHDLAISDFNKAIKLNPGESLAYNNRGYTFLVIHEYDRAIQDFNRSIEINPGNTLAHINRGNTFYKIKDRKAACSDWKQACEQSSCNKYIRAKNKRYCN